MEIFIIKILVNINAKVFTVNLWSDELKSSPGALVQSREEGIPGVGKTP